MTLVGGPFGWNGQTRMDSHGLPGSPAGCLVVEGHRERSAAALATLKPMTHFSSVSKLVENASIGRHNEGQVDALSLRRLLAWVDANDPYLGEEEIRRMPDPTFRTVERTRVHPRLATAPVVDRFHVPQDGDSQAVARASPRRAQ